MVEILDELNVGAITVNFQHRITAINHCAQAILGMRGNEILGQDCREVFTGVPCMVSCIVSGGNGSRHDDGTVHLIDEEESDFSLTRIATPIYDSRHRVVGCLTILKDHSPISDLIDRLRYEERSLKNILDSLDIGVFTVNRGRLITFFNTAAERISGYDRSEILGQSSDILFQGTGTASPDTDPLKEAIQSGRNHRFRRGVLMDKAGGNLPVRASTMALRDEKGGIVGGLTTFQDMTLVQQLNQAIHKRYVFSDMIGKSPAMQKIFNMIPVVAASNATVFIEGATGTGKDLLARIIHSTSPRAHRPWVKINCAAIPETLLESEFFGYVKGPSPVDGISRDDFRKPTVERFFWMKSPICRFPSRPNCCGWWKTGSFIPWEDGGRKRWMCGSFPPPIAAWNSW